MKPFLGSSKGSAGILCYNHNQHLHKSVVTPVVGLKWWTLGSVVWGSYKEGVYSGCRSIVCRCNCRLYDYLAPSIPSSFSHLLLLDVFFLVTCMSIRKVSMTSGGREWQTNDTNPGYNERLPLIKSEFTSLLLSLQGRQHHKIRKWPSCKKEESCIELLDLSVYSFDTLHGNVFVMASLMLLRENVNRTGNITLQHSLPLPWVIWFSYYGCLPLLLSLILSRETFWVCKKTFLVDSSIDSKPRQHSEKKIVVSKTAG